MIKVDRLMDAVVKKLATKIDCNKQTKVITRMATGLHTLMKGGTHTARKINGQNFKVKNMNSK